VGYSAYTTRKGDEICPASAVNVIGRIIGGSTVLKRVSEGERIVIDRVDG
jgi:hypothetical protein